MTLDAMGCQKDLAARIRAKRADDLLVLKPNHDHAFETVREHFEHTCFGRGSGGRPVFDALTKVMAAWSADASSWTWGQKISSPCAAGLI